MSTLSDVTIAQRASLTDSQSDDQGETFRYRPLSPSDYNDDLIEKKFQSWLPNFAVDDELMLFQLRELVTAVVRLEMAGKYERAMHRRMMVRADHTWELDRMSQALEIAAKLHRNPSRWREELLRTAQGCRWMLNEWRNLQRSLAHQGDWTERQYSHAQNLLGLDRIHRKENDRPEDLDREELDRMIQDQIDHLEALHENELAEFDEFERQQTSEGLCPCPDREMWAIRRYLADCQRRFMRLWTLMKPYYTAVPTTSSPRRAPAPKRTEAQHNPIKAAEADYRRILAAATELCSKASTPRNPAPVPAEAPQKSNPDAHQASGNRRQRRRAAALARRARS